MPLPTQLLPQLLKPQGYTTAGPLTLVNIGPFQLGRYCVTDLLLYITALDTPNAITMGLCAGLGRCVNNGDFASRRIFFNALVWSSDRFLDKMATLLFPINFHVEYPDTFLTFKIDPTVATVSGFVMPLLTDLEE